MAKIYKNEVRIQTSADVNRVLTRTINGLLVHGTISQSEARTVGYLCGIMLKGFETQDKIDRPTDIPQDTTFIEALKVAGQVVWENNKKKEEKS